MSVRLRRMQAAVGLSALLVAAGVALPTTSASISARSQGGSATFGYGEDPVLPGVEGLRQIVAAAVCGAAPEAEACEEPPPAETVPAWLVPDDEAVAAPLPAPVGDPSTSPSPRDTASPTPSPSPSPSHLPEPGERCETPECVEEAVHVVGAFADRLEELQRAEPQDVPEEAVETISAFADELRAMPEPPEDDLPLPEDTREALGALVEAGVLPAFTPECVANVGQLAALIAEQQAAENEEGATPSPTPTATCTPAESEPQPQPAPTPSPEPGVEPEPAPSGEPDESDYPYDGPGHRVRRVEPED